jgi:lysophospholipase L1-like esterase
MSDFKTIEGPGSRKKNWLRNLLALALGLSVFPFLEIVLIIFGVNPVLGRNMGNFGFEKKIPVFESMKSLGKVYWYPSPKWFGKMRYYNTSIRRFIEMPKPGSTFRILVLGDSSAAGYPFGPMAAFSKWLEIMLHASVPSRNVEVINLGINGISSYEVRQLYPQMLKANPDLVVAYLGHNDCMIEKSYSGSLWLDGLASRISHELLRFRLYRLIFKPFYNDNSEKRKAIFRYYINLRKKGLRPERDEYLYPLEKREKIADNFARNLDAIIRMTQKAKVPLVLCTVEYNALDFAPEGSVHGKKMKAEELKEWESQFSSGNKAYAGGDFAGALKSYQKASAIDDGYAMLRYKTGRSLAGLGRWDEAEHELRAAVELTDLPNRALSFINPIIREQGRKDLVYVADVQAAFKKAEQGKVPGDDFFMDSVHPNIEGHRLIANVIYQTMIEDKLAPSLAQSPGSVQTALDNYARSLSPEYLEENYLYMANEEGFIGRVRKTIQLSRKALSYIPNEKMASDMNQRFNDIFGNLDTSE